MIIRYANSKLGPVNLHVDSANLIGTDKQLISYRLEFTLDYAATDSMDILLLHYNEGRTIHAVTNYELFSPTGESFALKNYTTIRFEGTIPDQWVHLHRKANVTGAEAIAVGSYVVFTLLVGY